MKDFLIRSYRTIFSRKVFYKLNRAFFFLSLAESLVTRMSLLTPSKSYAN